MKSQKPHIIGIIPARYASGRFPAKMLAPIAGKSLIQRTYENALNFKILDQLAIATDHQEIYDHVKSFGAPVVMTSVECLTGSDRIAEALREYRQFDEAEIILGIQGDEPCVDPHVIESIAGLLVNDPEAAMATAITRLSEEDAYSASVVKCVVDQHQNALYFSRALIPAGHTQKFNSSVTYYRHIGIYGYRRNFLLRYGELPPTPLQLAENLEQLKVLEHGFRIKAAIVDDFSIGVDRPEDVQKVEQWLCTQNTFSSQAAFAPR